jgi:hypothetical protein
MSDTLPGLAVELTQDWRRDGIRLVPYRRYDGGTVQVGLVSAVEGSAPFLRLMPVAHSDDPLLQRKEDDSAGIIPEVASQGLIDGAGHVLLEDHQDPASRELVDSLGSRLLTEELRVDKMMDALLERPTTLVHGGEVHFLGGPSQTVEEKTE